MELATDANLATLIDCDAISPIEASDEMHQLALALIGAPSPEDLDDGEAYAIACAALNGATIAVDERKGRRIISQQWPNMVCVFTLDLIDLAARRAKLSSDEHADIVFNALHYSRMRIPAGRRSDTVALIGRDRAMLCPSLGFF